jgi:adenylate cyclase
MFTDMVGFTALNQSNEARALEVLERHNRLLRPFFSKFNGKEVKTIGDSFLVEFDSALDATSCAIEIQNFLHDYNISTKEDWKIKLRIGIHLGDVVRKGKDILGDAVNIASRIQHLADPEGICISEQVFDQVHNKIAYRLERLEHPDLKNISFATLVYAVVLPWEEKTIPQPTRQITHELDPRRVGVLPFSNMSPDPNDEYFADGLTEELIDRLSQVRGLEVIARTSMMSYKNKDKKISEIGKELLAATIIEGSVRKAGNKIRVTVYLVDARTERHLWSSRYDKTLDDIFAIQSDIASNVVAAIPAGLDRNEALPRQGKDTDDIIAYSEFLRARELLHETAESKIRNALTLFESAIQRDPNFARAYVGKALCYRALGMYAHISFLEAIESSRAHVEKALAINDRLAEAHAALGLVYNMEDKNRAAEIEARRAIELNPNLAEAYSTLANIRGSLGDISESIRLREKAYELDPLEFWNMTSLGDEYFWSGRDADALKIWSTSMKLAPYLTCDSLMDYYISKGNYVKAEETIRTMKKLEPNNPETLFWVGYLAAIEGNIEKAQEIIEQLNESSKQGAVTLDGIGIIYCALGDLDKFFLQMQRSIEAHTISLMIIRYSPLVAKARSDPRMQGLLEIYENTYD